MDGCPRQNPAYRRTKGRASLAGPFLFRAVALGLSQYVFCASVTMSGTDEQLVVRLMTHEDAAGVAELAKACYGMTYRHQEIYSPEQLIEDQEAGIQLNEVAVTEDGEVVSHSAFVFHGPTVVESCEAMTAELYRGHKLFEQLEIQLVERVQKLGVKWIMAEPVLLHTASQEVVVRGGGAITGVRLKCCTAETVDPDGFIDKIAPGGRRSLTIGFVPIAQLTESDVWVSSDYAELVAMALGQTVWPRTLRTEVPEGSVAAETSTLSSSFDQRQENMRIEVEVIGEDITDAVCAARDEAQAAGALSIDLRIPTGDPASASVALLEEGFSYAAFLPELREGSDVLLLQWLADRQIDTDVWQLLNPQIETLAHAIVAQAKLAAARGRS